MANNKKVWLPIWALILVGVLLTACGGGSVSSPNQAAGSTPGTVQIPSFNKTTTAANTVQPTSSASAPVTTTTITRAEVSSTTVVAINVVTPTPSPQLNTTVLRSVGPTTAVTTAAPSLSTAAANGSSGEVPEVVTKVAEAMGKARSFKSTLTTTNELKKDSVYVAPDRSSSVIVVGQSKTYATIIGKDYYISRDGSKWAKSDLTLKDSINPRGLVLPQGAKYKLLPDGQFEGHNVGMFMIEINVSSDPKAPLITIQTIRYDKQTFRILSVTSEVRLTELVTTEVRYYDYDNPDNKVEAPQI